MSSSLEDTLDREFAEAWRPEPGEKIVGEVVELSERDGTFGRYPIVTLRITGDDEVAVHAFHEVLANELARIAPQVKDVIGIKYTGKHPERGYHRYKVRRAGEAEGVDWGRYSLADDELDDAAEAAESAQAPLEGADDSDIPF